MNGRRAWIPIFLSCVFVAGCRTGRSYTGAAEPRYAGGRAVALAGRTADSLRVVSFNVAFAKEIDRAIALLTGEPALRDADVVLLQEMDADGTRRIADALGMAYVYYPALFHRRTRRDFGNAILSRWPIAEDAKLMLPHRSRYAGTHRIAVAATIRVGNTPVRVYSTHLGTIADVSAAARRGQLRAILADASRYDRVVIGGDMNSGSVGRVASELGFLWATELGPHTTRFGRWDHVFLKGLTADLTRGAGTVANARGASDHTPVWVRAALR